MERVTLKEYEAAKAAVLYGKEYEEISDMENNVIHKQYVSRTAAGRFTKEQRTAQQSFGVQNTAKAACTLTR